MAWRNMELEMKKEIMESVLPAFECTTCKAFPVLESYKTQNDNPCTRRCAYLNKYTCSCRYYGPICRNGHQTWKMLKIGGLHVIDWQINFLKLIPHPCKNGHYGCKEVRMLDKLDEHEATCDYRQNLVFRNLSSKYSIL